MITTTIATERTDRALLPPTAATQSAPAASASTRREPPRFPWRRVVLYPAIVFLCTFGACIGAAAALGPAQPATAAAHAGR